MDTQNSDPNIITTREGTQIDIEDKLGELFSASSGTGDEELIHAVERHSLQLSGEQIRVLLWFFVQSHDYPYLRDVVEFYLKLKHNNNSAHLILEAIANLAFRRWIGANAVKINVNK